MSCPVADGAYKAVHDFTFGGSRMFLFEDLEAEWEKLGVRIKADEPKATTKRLRGFYCIEVMYHLIFPSLELPVGLVSLREKFLKSRFDRDHAGLGKVIELCQSTYVGITVEQGEMQMENKSNNLFEHSIEHLEIPRAVSECCEVSARLLRPMLRGPVTSIGTIGRHFGEVLVTGNFKLEGIIRYLHTMLDVSIHNPVSPWTMQKPQASLST